MPEPVSVIIRGQLFPSQASAAKVLGMHPTSIHSALERGTLDRIGIGRNWNQKPVWLDSGRYESQHKCAEAIGVSDIQIYGRILRAKKRGKTSVLTPWGVLSW